MRHNLNSEVEEVYVVLPQLEGYSTAPLSTINEIGHKICSKCVMDSTDPDIKFINGVCNHCLEYERGLSARVVSGEAGQRELLCIVEKIKKAQHGKDYDCIVGVSGGVDSTYVAYQAKRLGLRPLAVHFDNGWNSELAVSNIEKVLNKLDIDLFTYVIDWEEFKTLQLSFLKASTPDAEIPTNHAIYALLLQTALKTRTKYILNGMNFSSEGIIIPAWAYGHSDWRYIKNVHKQFGGKPLRSYPHFGLFNLFYALVIRGVQFVSILNYLDYDKEAAIEVLTKELGWRPYGGKHHESVYTRFFQSYILPRKFKIDKRKAHLSNLIHSSSKKMTREAALQELQNDACPATQLEEDRAFVIKKFALNEQQFDDLMSLPVRSFRDYKTNHDLIRRLKRLQHFMRRVGLFYK